MAAGTNAPTNPLGNPEAADFPFAPFRCNPLLQKMCKLELRIIAEQADYTKFQPIQVRFLGTVRNAYSRGHVTNDQLKALERMLAEVEDLL